MDIRPITNFKKGGTGTVFEITNRQMEGKLIAMGILPGTKIEVIGIAPFNGGYYLKVDGHCMAIRKKEAAHILLEC